MILQHLGGCSNHDQVPVATVACQNMALCRCCGLAGGCRNRLHQLCDRVKYPGWKWVSSSKGGSIWKGRGHGLTKSSSHWAAQQEEITQQETSASSNQLFCSLTSKWSLPGMMIFHFLPVSPAYLWESDFTAIFEGGLPYFFSCTLLFAVAKCHLLSQHAGAPQSKGSGVWGNKGICLIQVSFGLSVNWEINEMSPSTPYWLGLCM